MAVVMAMIMAMSVVVLVIVAHGAHEGDTLRGARRPAA